MHVILLSAKLIIDEHGEISSYISQNWIDFCRRNDTLPVICPNDIDVVETLVRTVKSSAIILTGGGDISDISGSFNAREQVEEFLIDYCLSNDIPMLSVCRGAQKLMAYLGKGQLNKLRNHVKRIVEISDNAGYSQYVNSYHNFGFHVKDYRSDFLQVTHTSSDGIIKAVKHKNKKIIGIMWHPEREKIGHSISIIKGEKDKIESFNISSWEREKNGARNTQFPKRFVEYRR